jgi:hypothetical protein
MESHKKIADVITKVWQDKDYDLLRAHLADSVEWLEGPYREPLESPDAVVEQWREDLAPQSDIRVKTDVLAIEQEQGYYHCRASWTDAGRGRVEIDGIFLIHLNPEGEIAHFNQWYSIKPR